MYELPEDFDLGGFVGRTLHSVCFNENQIVFDFADADLSLVAEGALSHSGDAPVDAGAAEAIPVRSSSLMQLVGAKILACVSPDRRSIRLEFSNGQCVLVENDEHYESIRIYDRGREIIL